MSELTPQGQEELLARVKELEHNWQQEASFSRAIIDARDARIAELEKELRDRNEEYEVISKDFWETKREKNDRIAELEASVAYETKWKLDAIARCVKADERISELEMLNKMTDDEIVLHLKKRIAELEAFIEKVAMSPYWTSSAREVLYHESGPEPV